MRLLLIVYLQLVVLGVQEVLGAPMRSEVALDRARLWMEEHPVMTAIAERELASVVNFPEAGDYVVYVASFKGGGYVVLNSDDCLPLTVAFGAEALVDLADVPGNDFRRLLLAHVEAAEARLADGWEEVALTTHAVEAVSETEVVGPFLKSSWSQKFPYNSYCTVDPASGARAPTGCVPTAYAQVMKYYQWPVHGVGGYSYTDWGGIMGGDHFVELFDPYDWESMKDSYALSNSYDTVANNAVAELMYELGVLAETDYEVEVSVAHASSLARKLDKYMYYEYSKLYTSYSKMAEPMMESLRSGIPCVAITEDHAVVVDGFMGDDLLHINYGWGGVNNGWWSASAIPGSVLKGGVVGLQPRLEALALTDSEESQFGGTSVELSWVVPESRTDEIQGLEIEAWVRGSVPWRNDASTLPSICSNWKVYEVGGSDDDDRWAAYSGMPAFLVLDEIFEPDASSVLSFQMSYDLGSSTFWVEISSDGGFTYSPVFSASNKNSGWESYSIPLSDYAGESIRIRLSSEGGYVLHLDNLEINSVAGFKWEPIDTSSVYEFSSSNIIATQFELPVGKHTLASRLIDHDGIRHERSAPVTVWANQNDVAVGVTNLSVSQLPGTKIVEINYTLTGTTGDVAHVALAVKNGSETVLCESVEGELGYVEIGQERTALWDAGVDWDKNDADLEFQLLVFGFGGDFKRSTTTHVDTRNYMLIVHSDYGEVEPSIGPHVYPWGSTVSCSVLGQEGQYVCAGWSGSGSIPLSGSTESTGEIILSSLLSTIAWEWGRSAGSDLDEDGMNDLWELRHFGNLEQVADADYDGDGQTNLEEELAATDPTDPGRILYVYEHSKEDIVPYSKWESAAKNIQDAVNVAESGDTIILASGHYRLSDEISVHEEVTIQSLSGVESVIVDGQGSVRCFNLGDSNCTLKSLTITNGYSSASSGGGVYCLDRKPKVNNCIISGNWAESGGGMFRGTANNCVISGNSAKQGGGLYGGTANNCTVISNSASSGGGMYEGTANNCIVWYNTAPDGKDVKSILGYYSCFSGASNGLNGCISNDPQLARYRLTSSSPCIGAGSVLYATGTDIDGRIWGDPPSMGCNEYGLSSNDVLQVGFEFLSVTNSLVLKGVPVRLSSQILGRVSSIVWDFGDNSTCENLRSAEHSWSASGQYDVVLMAYNDVYPFGVATTQIITVVDFPYSAVYVASDGDDANDGLSWSTAKATIQAGVDAQALVNGWVLVGNGTYLLESEVVVDKNLIIRGAEGAESTVISGQGRVRCFNLGGSSCVLDGLTIINGYSSGNGGGIYCLDKVPEVKNCIISGSWAEYGGGMSGGTARSCLIIDNDASFFGGGLYNSSTENCTVVFNSSLFGGGLCGCTARNSIVWYNEGVFGNDIDSTATIYCCSPDVQATAEGGHGNAPLFVDAAGGDYRLQTNSPCIDKGLSDLVEMSTDLGGAPRVSGSAIDMGAYEYNQLYDYNGNSIPDLWELEYFGQTTVDANADPDHDSRDNYSEWIAGTDPANSSSCFMVTTSVVPSSGFWVGWSPCVEGRYYRVLWYDSLTNATPVVLEDHIGYPKNSFIDTAHDTETSGFYKVEVRLK